MSFRGRPTAQPRKKNTRKAVNLNGYATWFDLPKEIHNMILDYHFLGYIIRHRQCFRSNGKAPSLRSPFSILYVAKSFVTYNEAVAAFLRSALIKIRNYADIDRVARALAPQHKANLKALALDRHCSYSEYGTFDFMHHVFDNKHPSWWYSMFGRCAIVLGNYTCTQLPVFDKGGMSQLLAGKSSDQKHDDYHVAFMDEVYKQGVMSRIVGEGFAMKDMFGVDIGIDDGRVPSTSQLALAKFMRKALHDNINITFTRVKVGQARYYDIQESTETASRAGRLKAKLSTTQNSRILSEDERQREQEAVQKSLKEEEEKRERLRDMVKRISFSTKDWCYRLSWRDYEIVIPQTLSKRCLQEGVWRVSELKD